MLFSDLSTPEATARLTDFLNAASGVACLIKRAVPLSGGASRDMWIVDAAVGGTAERLVLRRDLPTSMVETALSREQEFIVMRAAFDAGVRVAEPRWLCADPDVLGSPFFLMNLVQGTAIGRKVVSAPELANARRALPDQLAAALAKIHQMPIPTPTTDRMYPVPTPSIEPDHLDFLRRPPVGMTPAQEAIAQTYVMLDALQVINPTFEFLLRWAEQHAPIPETLTFVHGDFRIGNLIVDAEGLAAVADWEFAHVGDPDEELGYLCMRDWRFGAAPRVGGISEREPFLVAYERESGRQVNRSAVDFWEFLGNVRWGVICLSQANRHLSGRDPSVELASLGRRSAEMQLEALRMIRAMESST